VQLPGRKIYLQQQVQAGRQILGVLPALYPQALLWAFDILPVEIWDPPGELSRANAHLQATICPVVKRSLSLILTEPDQVNRGYLFPHTCDSLQNLATQVQDLLGISLPVYSFYNPKSAVSPASRNYYQALLADLQKELENAYGPLDQNKFKAACQLQYELDNRLFTLRQARLEQRLTLSNADYFKLLRAGEYLDGADYLRALQAVELGEHPLNNDNLHLLVSGILPPDLEILKLLDAAGVTIVADDLLSTSRRHPIIIMDPPDDPLEFLVDRYFLLPPCSTRSFSLTERLRYLKKLAVAGQINGIYFNIIKFCEPELFDHRTLVAALKAMDLPVLSLETELEPGLSGQTRTRIEAFLEILTDRTAQ